MNKFMLTAAMAALFVTACGSPPVVQQVVEKTIYVCSDGTELETDSCPPENPRIEIVTKFVCPFDGPEVTGPDMCPEWTVSCPEGTTALEDPTKGGPGCTYNATCHEGWAYEPSTSTCKKYCQVGEMLSTDGINCVPVPDSNPRDCPLGQYLDANGVCQLIPVAPTTLTVAVSLPPASATYVKGAQNVDMLGVLFTVGTSDPVRITSVTFNMFGDSYADVLIREKNLDPNAFVTSCSIYDAVTGGLIAGPESFSGTHVVGQGLDITFNGFSWTVRQEQPGKMLLRCNFGNVMPADGNNDVWAAEINSAADITAMEVNSGNAVVANGAETINTSASVAITIVNSGSLTVSTSGATPAAMIVLGESFDVLAAEFRFQATTEAMEVRSLRLQNVRDDAAIAIVKIRYTNVQGSTITKTNVFVNGATMFMDLDIWVSANGSTIVQVLVDTPTVGGVESGIGIMLFVSEYAGIGITTGQMVGRGFAQGRGPHGSMMVLRKTKPTISLASGSLSGAQIPGPLDALRFNVSADAKGFVNVRQLLFQITSTDNDGETGVDWNEGGNLAQTNKWLIYDAVDMSTPISYASQDAWLEHDGTPADGTDDVEYFRSIFTTPIEIGAGQTRTFVLKVDTTGASSANDDSIRIDIPSEVDVNYWGLDALRWDDDTAATNIDGALVKNLPVIGGTLVF